MTEDNIQSLQIITLGSADVGKTCILRRYFQGDFGSSISTIGIDCKCKLFDIDSHKLNVMFNDTAGQERYSSITNKYLRNTQGVILVYDITNKQSFDKISEWSEKLKSNNNKYSCVLVGNKCDLEKKREVTKEEGLEKSKELEMDFFETSAKEDININEMIDKIVNLTYNKFGMRRKSLENSLVLKKQKKKKKKCC